MFRCVNPRFNQLTSRNISVIIQPAKQLLIHSASVSNPLPSSASRNIATIFWTRLMLCWRNTKNQTKLWRRCKVRQKQLSRQTNNQKLLGWNDKLWLVIPARHWISPRDETVSEADFNFRVHFNSCFSRIAGVRFNVLAKANERHWRKLLWRRFAF